MTKRAEVTFTVKEYGDGTPSIAIEFHSSEPGFPVQNFGFDVRPGITIEQVEELASHMKRLLDRMKVSP